MSNLINWMVIRLAMVREQEEGQALVEYGLILSLIAVVCIVALTALGGGISGLLDGITGSL